MDGSNISLLNSMNYIDILKEIAAYCRYEDIYDKYKTKNNYSELMSEVNSILPYNISNHARDKSLFEILEDLGIQPEITEENFYLLVRSIKLIRLNKYSSCLGNGITGGIRIKNKKIFVRIFKNIYKNKYDDVFNKIITKNYFNSVSLGTSK